MWPETNIVLIEEDLPEKLLAALAEEGVLATPGGRRKVRFCTHLDVTDADVEAAVGAAQKASVSVSGG